MPSAAIPAGGPGAAADEANGASSENGSGGCEVGSMEHVRSSEAFPLAVAERLGSSESEASVEAGKASVWPPFPLLQGESVSRFGRAAGSARLFLTNYRFLVLGSEPAGLADLPLLGIESVDVRELFTVVLASKDGRLVRVSFDTNEDALSWSKVLTSASGGLERREKCFAFAYRAWCVDEARRRPGGGSGPELRADHHPHSISRGGTQAEFHRLGFSPRLWRVSSVNEGFELCASYPETWILPAGVTDEEVRRGAGHRWLKRAPAAVWRSRSSGALLLRSSQPSPGLFSWRNDADEALLLAFADAAAADSPRGDGQPAPSLLVVDARSYAAAWANRAKGGGFESPEYYQRSQVQFMGLANIHAIRNSFAQLRSLLGSGAGAEAGEGDGSAYLQSLHGAGWLQHLSLLLGASVRAAAAIQEGRSVLVHCSDGWDRTPQIVSLTKLLLDPQARTVHGFRSLVERDWVEFGHKFEDRLGLLAGGNPSERSPVFLQFLDAVHQLLLQFPLDFQFSQAYLAKLAQHTTSGLFGTFLCNSASEVVREKVRERTFPVWALLGDAQYQNLLYQPSQEPLWPQTAVGALQVWRNLYCPQDQGSPRPRSSSISSNGQGGAGEQRSLNRTQSCDSLNSEASTAAPQPPPALSGSLTRTGSDSHLPYSLSSHVVEELVSASHPIPQASSSPLGQATPDQSSPSPQPAKSNGSETPRQESQRRTPQLVAEALDALQLAAPPEDRRESFTEDPLWSDDARFEPSSQTTVPSTISTSTSDISDSLVRRRVVRLAKPSTEGGAGSSRRRRKQLADFLDPDGLPSFHDPVQERIRGISRQYMGRINRMEAQIQHLRAELGRSRGRGSGGAGGWEGAGTSEAEWVEEGEAVDEGWAGEEEWEGLRDDATKWVPDHAVSHCMACDAGFWAINRRHHCRSCGKVFCSKCSSGMAAVPEEALFQPVRVCDPCFSRLSAHNTPTADPRDLSPDDAPVSAQASDSGDSQGPSPQPQPQRLPDDPPPRDISACA